MIAPIFIPTSTPGGGAGITFNGSKEIFAISVLIGALGFFIGMIFDKEDRVTGATIGFFAPLILGLMIIMILFATHILFGWPN